MKNLESQINSLKNEKEIFFNFMKEKYPIFYNSNIFFRDVQYAIKSFFERRNNSIKYSEAESLAHEFIKHLESNGEFIPLNKNTWKVNFSLQKAVTINEQKEPVS